MTRPDGRVIAAANESRVLYLIHRLGWALTSDITATGINLRVAQRTLKRLREHHQILTKPLPDSRPAHVLAQRGAARVREEWSVEAHATSDTLRSVSMASYRHRVLANDLALWWMGQQGDEHGAWTERDILTGRTPCRPTMGKVPDALLRAGEPWECYWVEVERAKKKDTDYRRVVNLTMRIANPKLEPLWLSPGEKLAAVRMVLAADASDIDRHVNRLVAALRSRGADPSAVGNSVMIATRLRPYHWTLDHLDLDA
jgi:hypothetical protein